MAAKVESAEAEQTNTIDPERLKKEVARIEEALERKLSHRMKYVESCKPINEAVANAYEIASKAAGVSMKVLKATIKQRELQRKIEGIPENFEDETRETFDMVCQALGDFGDLPLGAAALVKFKGEGGTTATVESANPSAIAAAKMMADKSPVEEPKKPRGRPRKAPSPDAASAAEATELGETIEVESSAKDGEASPDVAGLDPKAVAETDHPTYERGHKAGLAGTGCTIPGELSGLYRDRWHAGWLAGDAARHAASEQNAERLRSGISPLH